MCLWPSRLIINYPSLRGYKCDSGGRSLSYVYKRYTLHEKMVVIILFITSHGYDYSFQANAYFVFWKGTGTHVWMKCTFLKVYIAVQMYMFVLSWIYCIFVCCLLKHYRFIRVFWNFTCTWYIIVKFSMQCKI